MLNFDSYSLVSIRLPDQKHRRGDHFRTKERPARPQLETLVDEIHRGGAILLEGVPEFRPVRTRMRHPAGERNGVRASDPSG